MTFKKGDHVRVTTHEFDTTPDGAVNDCYGYGVSGVIDHFRTNRFSGKQATVELDDKPGHYVDWTLTNIERTAP